ncbi:hypothetical protein GGS23DRAFT_570200 [Durotheca rogersii]|uniref:uncharacterized protein n=1 Tax=Durotheca rogersii TaxID=419775 RepID=UPI002220E68F|nr:uncharacterized protein GGS23DRAFT_570200 [Durotheca rogersii]KAI5862927.1 hypothetical protein GGS23DRAFT_570200 [Durotheca rogersii]
MAVVDEPSEEAISLFCDITGLPRTEAITRLKVNNNDIQRASEEYFEDPDRRKYKWDESQFSMGRQGEAGDEGISFNVQGPDELPPTDYQNTAAPTRPPSRVNNRSPFGAPTNAAEEDAHLKRALAESAAESGIPPPQEVGIITDESNPKYFGPANRSEYETEQWAMVPTKATVDTAKAEPSPSQRKRDPNAPAFLCQTKDHRVGAILSIYHKIPLVRNILLQCGRPAHNYGHNSEWWKGQPILAHEHLAAMKRGDLLWGDDAHPEFAEELHRLMAFLDNTERSYGTVDTLVETKAVDPNYGAWVADVEDALFDAIKEGANENPACDLAPMTTMGAVVSCDEPHASESRTEGGRNADSWGDDEQDNEQDNPFIFLDIQLEEEHYELVKTLYDALDHLFWSHALSLDHSFPENAKFAVLSKPPEVITIRLGSSGLVGPCEIPPVLYADRYMSDRKHTALHLQKQLRALKSMQRLCWAAMELKRRCRAGDSCVKLHGLGHPHDNILCYCAIIEFCKQGMQRQVRTAQWRYFFEPLERGVDISLTDLESIQAWSGPYTLEADEEARMETFKRIIDGSEREMEKVLKDMQELDEESEEYIEMMDVVRKRLTCQEHEVDDVFVSRSTPQYRPEYWNPTRKYSLRGVALSRELAYVSVREEVELMDIDAGEPMSKDQWWKIGYAASDASPVKTERVTLEHVLCEAETGSKFPILIYASEAAMEAKPIPLSDALRMFVRADNRSFQQELAQEQQNQEPNPPQPQDPAPSGVTVGNLSYIAVSSPSKRKHSIGSSVATGGSSRDDLNDVDLTFDDHDRFPDQHIPDAHYQTPPDASVQSTKPLGGIVESLAKCQTGEAESRAEYGGQEGIGAFTSNPPALIKSPEMQERVGGSTPFLARPGPTTQSGPVDMMDIDMEVDSHEG